MLSTRLYVLGFVALACVGGLAWGGHTLYRLGYDAAVLAGVKDAELIERAAKTSQQAAAEAVSNIQVKHVTIRQSLEKELTRDVVYRDCVASPRVLDLTNQAITGAPDAPTDRVLPAPEPANGR